MLHLIYILNVPIKCTYRDGNPNVTPKVTYEVAITQRLRAAKLILNDVDTLYAQLAVCKGNYYLCNIYLFFCLFLIQTKRNKKLIYMFICMYIYIYASL